MSEEKAVSGPLPVVTWLKGGYTNDPYIESIEIPINVVCVPTENPIILSIIDVPADQGGDVIIEFTRSYYDDDGLINMFFYYMLSVVMYLSSYRYITYII